MTIFVLSINSIAMQKSVINKLTKMRDDIEKMSTSVSGIVDQINEKLEREEMKDNPNDDKIDEWECDVEALESISENLEEFLQSAEDTIASINEALDE